MCQMFSGCSSLKELNLSNFNNINVIDMVCSMDVMLNFKIKLELNIKI